MSRYTLLVQRPVMGVLTWLVPGTFPTRAAAQRGAAPFLRNPRTCRVKIVALMDHDDDQDNDQDNDDQEQQEKEATHDA